MTGRTPILKRMYWILSDPAGRGAWPEGLLARILPLMNQNADLYVISQDILDDWDHLVRLLEDGRAHLEQWGFCRLNLRPVHPVRMGEGDSLQDVYRSLLQWGNALHKEALRHQVASRWMVLPVLLARSPSEVKEVMVLAEFLRELMMVPSLCLPLSPRLQKWAERVDTSRERILLEDPEGPLQSVALHDLFDDLLQWSLSSAGGFSLRPCSSLVVDTVRGAIRRCPRQEEREYSELEQVLQEDGAGGECLACWHALPERIRGALRLNLREDEGDRIQHQLGVFALSRGHLEDAERHFKEIAGRASSKEIRGETLLYLGILHLQKGDVDAAQGALVEARGLMPDSSAVLYHLGRCEFSWHDYIAAADLFHKALDAGVPGEIETDLRLYLGISHVQLEEFPEALQALEKAPRHLSSVLFYEAMALLGLGRLREALEGFQESLAEGPDREDLASVHFYIGHCLKEMDQWEEAIPSLREALKSDSESYEAWNLLGYCYFRLKRHQDSIQAFRKALEIDPRSAIDHANIGSNLRDLGKLKEAATWYRKALKLDPTLGFAAQNLERLEEMKRER